MLARRDETNWLSRQGPSTSDIAHRVVGDFVYQTPFEAWTSSRILKRLIGGWQFAGTFNVQADRIDITEKS